MTLEELKKFCEERYWACPSCSDGCPLFDAEAIECDMGVYSPRYWNIEEITKIIRGKNEEK